jgi:hypothetical protein
MLAPTEKIMSTALRSTILVLALLGTTSAVSATTWSYGHGHGKSYGRWVKVDGKWKHDTRAFFDQIKKNSGS